MTTAYVKWGLACATAIGGGGALWHWRSRLSRHRAAEQYGATWAPLSAASTSQTVRERVHGARQTDAQCLVSATQLRSTIKPLQAELDRLESKRHNLSMSLAASKRELELAAGQHEAWKVETADTIAAEGVQERERLRAASEARLRDRLARCDQSTQLTIRALHLRPNTPADLLVALFPEQQKP